MTERKEELTEAMTSYAERLQMVRKLYRDTFNLLVDLLHKGKPGQDA